MSERMPLHDDAARSLLSRWLMLPFPVTCGHDEATAAEAKQLRSDVLAYLNTIPKPASDPPWAKDVPLPHPLGDRP